ncbi:MAG: hypothetical protein OEZ43_04740 [Gammaproteobacteria bacterium]|nr:hypothetical protein [Gammaproteobacteria bacterium]
MSENSKEQVCRCPDHWPDWDGAELSLSGRCVHRMSIPSFFHMPLAFDMYVGKQAENIEQLDLKPVWPGLVFSRTGMWGGELICLIEDAESPSRLVQYLPPPFDVHFMLHHGGIGTIQKTLREQQMRLTDAGKVPGDLYMGHLTCPVCEERKGGEKILMMRRWKSSKRLQGKISNRASTV